MLGPRDGRLVAVGRIVDIRPNSSTVLLLTDELSAAAAYLSSGTLEGLVQGQDGPRLRMNYLNAESELSTGWAEARGTSRLDWDRARAATRDAWDRVGQRD